MLVHYESDDVLVLAGGGIINCSDAEARAKQLVPHRDIKMVSHYIGTEYRVHLVPMPRDEESTRVKESRIDYHGQETNASLVIEGDEAGMVLFIDDKCGGLLVRIYHQQVGTSSLLRMTREEAEVLRRFLFRFETGI